MSASLVITGAGHAVLPDGGCDPLPYLRSRKSRKYMGLQDELAVVATGRALERAGLERDLGRQTGLYVAVGYIPFRAEDADPVLAGSLDPEGEFSLRRFGEDGFRRANPLLTFRCLPNMPAYHVSVNFDVQGPYLVTYPGPAQLYAALEEACAALEEGRVERALVGAVAHQRNFLVEHHFGRLAPSVVPDALRDVGAMVLLEREDLARAQGRVPLAWLERLSTRYVPPDVLGEDALLEEQVVGLDVPLPAGELGPAGLGVALSLAVTRRGGGTLRHLLRSRDGVSAESEWRFA